MANDPIFRLATFVLFIKMGDNEISINHRRQ